MKKILKVAQLGTPLFQTLLNNAALPYKGNLKPIRALLQALKQPPLTCQTVLFEYEYVDKDYQNEYASFYSKSFKNYPARCTRLHFFAAKIPLRVRLQLRQYRKQYLGFMILRPTDLQRMGRTVIKPTLTDPNHQFIHCHAKFSTHLFGEEFEVQGMPFIQQDTQVGACAQASLWMVARYMSAKFNLREYYPGEINQLAKANLALGRPLPAGGGLIEWQMLDALQAMGFSAVSYSCLDISDCSRHIDAAFPVDALAVDKKNESLVNKQERRRLTAKLADIAYRYIESGLPVIFETHNHALVGIGHTYDRSVTATVAIQRIPDFYVHNDNAGPYKVMPIFRNGPPTDEVAFEDIESIIAILPAEVNLRGEEAETMARIALEEFINQNANLLETLTINLQPKFTEYFKQLEYRTYLMQSIEFQRGLRLAISGKNFHRKLGHALIRLDYPKYVWITEISSSVFLNKPNRKDRQCLGRVIIDSTAPARTRGELAIHCGDLLYLANRSGGMAEKKGPPWLHFPKSTPFPHKSAS